MNMNFAPTNLDVFVPCTVCGDRIGKVKNTYKIGYEIEGLKYCKFCGDVLRYKKAIQSQK